ncbi:MAG: ATP synthase F1 subunit gamma [Planctomycetota bacterium]
MANARVLVRRRKVVRNTRKITKTMEKISTARLAKAQAAALAARPYSSKLKEIITDVISTGIKLEHPLLESRAQPKNAMIILLTSDRGLCGAFNSNLIRLARTLIANLKTQGRTLQFIVQGKKGIGAFKYLKLPITERLIGISDKPTYARAEIIADKLIAGYSKKEIDEVYIIYSAFKTGSAQQPKQEMLLPLLALQSNDSKAKTESRKDMTDYLFHPDPKTILAQALPLVVKMTLFTAMLENTASEHATRRVAMKNATDNADEMIKDLTRVYNRARQGKITREIAEIVGGANAL